ncbi:N-6 DNA methylase [Pseudanabaena minima]|uniref:N-6 DNA methylase n=1 Tax=Pseudanabaena minima TaxID=890415 RepID=UPI003DA86EDA
MTDKQKTLEQTIKGMEFKPLPFMLAVTNLFLHEIEVPNIEYTDSLNREYTSIKEISWFGFGRKAPN